MKQINYTLVQITDSMSAVAQQIIDMGIKIREYNYNITKDMTPQERREYYNKRGMEVHRQIQEMQLQEV